MTKMKGSRLKAEPVKGLMQQWIKGWQRAKPVVARESKAIQ